MARQSPTITVNINMSVDTVPQLMAALKALRDREILVGFPDDNSRQAGAGPNTRNDGPLNNATIGFLMNNGSPANNLPAREFMEPGVHDAENKIVRALQKGGAAAMAGDLLTLDKSMNAAGLVAVSGIKNKIVSGPFQALAPSTLAARRRRGRTGTRPLNDTGQLRAAVSYVIRER